jgi:Asp-tRNA(Asn)/Glu-tRNA(Gln) amidotransferase C subunit
MKRRQDKVTDADCADDIVKNASMVEDNFFVLPKVVD